MMESTTYVAGVHQLEDEIQRLHGFVEGRRMAQTKQRVDVSLELYVARIDKGNDAVQAYEINQSIIRSIDRSQSDDNYD